MRSTPCSIEPRCSLNIFTLSLVIVGLFLTKRLIFGAKVTFGWELVRGLSDGQVLIAFVGVGGSLGRTGAKGARPVVEEGRDRVGSAKDAPHVVEEGRVGAEC